MGKIVSSTLGGKIKRVLVGYFTSQFILTVAIALVVWGGLFLLNVRYALLLGVLTGVLSTIPNFGIITASIVVALVAIFDHVRFLPKYPEFVEGLLLLLALALLNKIVDMFLLPIFLAKVGKANPIAIFAVVIIGTFFFGFVGAILATPIFLILKTIWEHYRR
jgi:predicted PurR-regulated permease PerM